jgi:tRNA(His) 5'-end guanylyltransferase
MERPFDERFSSLMVDTALFLAKETGASVAYTQSDEITLAWHAPDARSQIWFDGRVTKMTSQLSALATLWFNRLLAQRAPELVDRLPTFDARVWQVPTRGEAVNVFIWREWDATKNSISMAASSHFSAGALHGKNGSVKQEMLWAQKGINWDKYPAAFKRGTYVQRKKACTPFTGEEIDRLPPKHRARTEPNLVVERSVWRAVSLPIITTITNREDVLFEGAEPQVAAAS